VFYQYSKYEVRKNKAIMKYGHLWHVQYTEVYAITTLKGSTS